MKSLSKAQQNQLAALQFRIEKALQSQSWVACLEACRALLKVDANHHFAQETLVTALLQTGATEEAIVAVRRLLEISPRDPLHRLRLATLLQMGGQPGESLREFERISAMYPDAPFSNDAEEAVENLDRLQTQQILLMAAEQDSFRWGLERDIAKTLEENGFYLTENGFESLRQMIPGAEDDIPERAPRVH
jgi:predicted Zn-dependent protease